MSALLRAHDSNSISRRAVQWFSPSFAVPYRMLKVITVSGSPAGDTAAGAGDCARDRGRRQEHPKQQEAKNRFRVMTGL